MSFRIFYVSANNIMYTVIVKRTLKTFIMLKELGEDHNIYRLITAFLVLRVNLDKIMHSR